jgi:signal transduction histidine kinase
VKFTGERGRINVSAEVDTTGTCIIAIQDNGRGMSEEEIAQARQPFGKGNAGLNRDFDGAGLGLPITNAWVALHQGQLIIESARGVGTLVMVKFPAMRVKFVGEEEPAVSLAGTATR